MGPVHAHNDNIHVLGYNGATEMGYLLPGVLTYRVRCMTSLFVTASRGTELIVADEVTVKLAARDVHTGMGQFQID